MPGQDFRVELENIFQQLSYLVVLAGCTAMASKPKPVTDVPALGTEQLMLKVKAPDDVVRRKKLSPELREFKRYPVLLQRQMLDYGQRYADACFEAKNGPDY